MTIQELKVKYTTDGEEHESSLIDFLIDNADDIEPHQLANLMRGEPLVFGGGAAPLTVVGRLAWF